MRGRHSALTPRRRVRMSPQQGAAAGGGPPVETFRVVVGADHVVVGADQVVWSV